MSLRWKIILLLAFAFVLTLGSTVAVERYVLLPSYLALERHTAVTNMERCVDALRGEVDHLAILCNDWAAWDDTYRYIEDDNPQYVAANLTPETMKNAHLDVLCFCNVHGKIVWTNLERAPASGDGRLATLAGAALPLEDPLLRDALAGQAVQGVVLTERGPMLAVSRPILTSNSEGPSRGAVIMGRLLNEKALQALTERTRVDLVAWPIDDALESALAPPDRHAFRAVVAGEPRALQEESRGRLNVYATVPGISGAPALFLKVRQPRDISAQGRTMGRFTVASNAAASLALMLLVWVLLERMVVKPLTRLTAHTTRVGQTGDLSAQLPMPRRDEIGALAGEFNRMVRSLAEFRARLLDAAHRAGMADTAVGVLHNVGNALNSVGVSTEVLGEKLRQSRVESLGKAAALLNEHRDHLGTFLGEDERGRKLTDYLPKLCKLLLDERRQLLGELDALAGRVQHIKDVIAAQQVVAAAPWLTQDENVEQILEEALSLHGDLLRQHDIEVQRDIAALPVVRTSRRKLVQVLENLIKHATESMLQTQGTERRLTVRATRPTARIVRIEVCDTGAGFPPGDRERIFAQGYTTKAQGAGIGLHYCANAMIELGGRIEAHSDGPGHGARFVLDLPLQAAGVTP